MLLTEYCDNKITKKGHLFLIPNLCKEISMLFLFFSRVVLLWVNECHYHGNLVHIIISIGITVKILNEIRRNRLFIDKKLV